MKKTLAVMLLLCLLSALVLTACTQDPPVEENPAADEQPAADNGSSENENGFFYPISHEGEKVIGQEENEAALASAYADVQPSDCIGRFHCPLLMLPLIELKEDGSFLFLSPLSSYKTSISGTYELDGNRLILHPQTDYTLSFSFRNADTLVFHPQESSDLTDFLVRYTEDVAFIREK